MPDLTPSALELLLRQHGVASSPQLATVGINRKRRVRLVDDGVLEHVSLQVYRLAGSPLTLAQRAGAASLAHPAGFITGPVAGMLRGLRRMPRTASIHLAVRHGTHLPATPGVIFTQTTKLGRGDSDVRPDGIRIAAPARLAFDLAAHLSPIDHQSVVDQLLHEHQCSLADLEAVGRRLCHPGRRGSQRFADSLALVNGAPRESHPEVVLATRLRAAGVPIVAQTTWLELPRGGRARIDLSVPALKWGIEIDVHPSHLGITGTTADKARDRQCHLVGWQIERVTGLDLSDLDRTTRELVALYHARLTRVSA